MAVSLKELYENVKREEEIFLVAGERGLSNTVGWVHMVESIDISAFLEGGELAFTTGIALDSLDELVTLVKYNHKMKAAGMVINVGPYISKIPKEVLAFANEHDFPVFEVPWRVHMANIMRYISMHITVAEQQEIEITAAIKNAVYFPENETLYLPSLMKYGYKREWSYCLVVMEVLNRQFILVDEKTRERIVNFAKGYFHSWGQNVFVMKSDMQFIFVFANANEEWIKGEMQKLWEKIQTYICEKGVMYAGMGRQVKSILHIGESFQQAEQVKNLQKKRNIKNGMGVYRELGLYKLLLSVKDDAVLEEYYMETLGKLEKYDRINETDFLYFLKQYFEIGCNVQKLAEKMHLHRNSVTYKMHKIEEILKMSVNEPIDRTKLIVAFMIRELYETH